MDTSGYMKWDEEISQEGLEATGGGFTVHEPGEFSFKVEKFEKSNVADPQSAYHKAFMAKLVLNVEGSTVFENITLHKKFEWKLKSLFEALGFMDRKPSERWAALLGATGRVRVKKTTYIKQTTGEEKEKNEVDYFINASQVSATSGITNGLSEVPPPPVEQEPLPWEE